MKLYYFFLISSDKSEWRVIILFVLFAVIIVGAYYATYFIAKVQQGTKRNNNMRIIEAISVGQNKSLQLVRLGDKYVVIGVTKTQITSIITLEEDELELAVQSDSKNNFSFKSVLEKIRHKEEKVELDRGEEHHETKDE